MSTRHDFMKSAAIFAATCAAALVGTTESRADITLEVADTQSFADAVVAAGSSVSALNGGAEKSEKIIKTGSGTLTMSVHDLNLASWEGDFVIRDGTVRVTVNADYANTPGILGSNTVGRVTVEEGATLEMYSEKIVSAYSYSYGQGPLRPVHISGTGVGGKGALRLEIESGAEGGAVRTVVPKNLILDDNATIGWINKFGVVRDSNSVDLGGKTLTFLGEYASGSGTMAWYDFGKGFVNPGSLVFDGVNLYSRSTNHNGWEGDDSHSVTFMNGASVCWDGGNYVGFNWRLAGTPASFINNTKGGYDLFAERANWYGPMTLESTVELYYQSGNNDTDRSNKMQCTSLLGKISGAGGFLSDATSTNPKYNIGGWKMPGLNLGGDGNDFTGPLALKGMMLGLYSTNAIPHANDNIVLTNCVVKTVVLGGTNPAGKTDPAVTSLETLRIVDGGTIDGNTVLSRVEAEKIIKSGAGTLDVNLPMDVNRLEISDGTVKLFQVDAGEIDLALFRRSTAGLQYGYLPKTDGNDGYVDIDNAPFNVYVTNSVIRIPLECDAPVEKWNSYFHVSNHAYRTYSGYVWNDEEDVRNWTFLVTFNGKWDLTVAGETRKNDPRTPLAGANHPVPTLCTFTLQPGANEFRFRAGNHYVSTPNYGTVATNGLENWTSDRYAWGLAYDPQGRGSMDANYYTPFSTNEVIPVFTTTVPRGISYASRIGTLAGASAATFDLSGQTVSVDAVEGCMNVANGTLAGISEWKLTAAETIDPGTYANGFNFASGAVVDVADESDLAALQAARASGPFLLAVDFTGSKPVVSQRLRDAGWNLLVEDGDLKLRSNPGLLIIVR